MKDDVVLLNGEFLRAADFVTFPIESLVFWPKSKRRTTIFYTDEAWARDNEVSMIDARELMEEKPEDITETDAIPTTKGSTSTKFNVGIMLQDMSMIETSFHTWKGTIEYLAGLKEEELPVEHCLIRRSYGK